MPTHPTTCFGTLPRLVQRRMLREEDLRSDPEQLFAKTCFSCLPSASQGLLPVYPLAFPRTGLEEGESSHDNPRCALKATVSILNPICFPTEGVTSVACLPYPH